MILDKCVSQFKKSKLGFKSTVVLLLHYKRQFIPNIVL